MDNPTKRILYSIETSIPFEDDEVRWTADEIDAQLSYNRGFLVEKHEIIESLMTTRQKVMTILTTNWRGR
jgi:hypothetical protein